MRDTRPLHAETRPALHRLGLPLLALLALAAPASRTSAEVSISSGGIHVPTVTNFCGGNDVIVEVTFCNTDDIAHSFDVELVEGGTPPAYPCTESVVPAHTFLDPVPFVVGAGQCRTFRIRVARPDALDSHASVCYWLLFTLDTGGGVSLGAQLVDTFFTCFDWAFEEQVIFVHPFDPVLLNPSITNHSLEPIVFDYRIEVRDSDGDTDQGVIVLNDGGFAEPVEGSVDIPAGETVELALSATWLDPEASGFFDIAVLGDVPGPGRAVELTLGDAPFGRRAVGELASIGLAVTSAVVTVAEPGVVSNARLRAVPNPWPDGEAVAFTFDAPLAWQAVSFHDAAGRTVRSLRPASAGVARPITWDGRDDTGRHVPPGVYFARVRTAGGVQHAKVVRIP